MLLGLLMQSVLSAETAVLAGLHPLGMSLLVLHDVVVTILALSAR